MSKKRTILIEAAIVMGVLAAGVSAAQAAHASPLQTLVQAADSRANVKIESKVLVERTEQNDAGQAITKLYEPTEVKVIPGDRLVFVNSYRNTGSSAVTGFVVNNPVHSAVSFTGVNEDWATVSVDGGKSFGKLTEFTITEDGPDAESIEISRAAQPSDVTHIRWTFDNAIAAGASGELRFSGVVK
ncbi:hypothetical protein GCM10009096_20760 [Parasphingorhabdus litoris]|uniref:DUF11 domain-containing protein n=1 Tax=Parasphingorhabdus litoris TaxID=394733 RepID=A0ABN1AKA5_9SPHN|nr:hypothetical protein [Parasphingorhabdus litoris]